MRCAQCGHEFSVGIFCPECGHKYDADEVARIEKEKEELERQARKKLEQERLEREKADQERIHREKQEAEARRREEEERKAREQAEAERVRREEEELAARTYNGKVYADKEEAELAKSETDKVDELKQRLLSTKKQDERRKMIAEFGAPPVTKESRQRYDELKAKSELEKPKSIIINWIYGITVLIAFIPAVTLSVDNGAVYYIALAWAGCGFYIWIIWKIVLLIKSKGKKYYLNIKHI
jgi:hypothetical protein